MTAYFIQAFIYLCAAVIAVPLARRLGLGSVMGYLIAGVVIGPVVGLVGEETTTLQHFAEFGVVMMLFLVGLELEPELLWSMRRRLFGLGGLQVTVSTLVFMQIALLFDIDWREALTIGLILSLSSTAIVLQTLKEKGLLKTEGGRGAFSVLLFQDIAVIPMLALIPLLELPEIAKAAKIVGSAAAESHGYLSLLQGLPNWIYTIIVLTAIASVVFGGFYLSRPLFRFVAMSGLREVFTATALMLVIGIAALMSLVGLSPALGTFLAGVVLANSEFRHELESNIEPFKGLLLGLFFITIGAGINFEILWNSWLLIAAITAGVILVKAGIVYALARFFHLHFSDRWLISLGLAQAGEFGFVLLSFSFQNHVLANDMAQLLAMVITLTMFLTPALFIFFERVLTPRFNQIQRHIVDTEIHEKSKVLIAGIGRFGQIVNRLLVANGIETVVLDHDAKLIENLRQLNIKSYFGDATRPEMLEIAGIEDVSLFIIAIDDVEHSVELVRYMKSQYPKVTLMVRAYGEIHLYRLKQAGADIVIKETYYSALEVGAEALVRLGYKPKHAEKLKTSFITSEEKAFDHLYNNWISSRDSGITPGYRELFMQQEKALREAMQEERADSTESEANPPLKIYDEEMLEDSEK